MSGGSDRPTGVLVMAHGTPDTPEGIEAFYTRIRRGRPPTPELLDELAGRYAAIGGTSPLTARTAAQVDGLAAALDGAEPGRFVVRLGTKHVRPTIEEAMAELAAAGVSTGGRDRPHAAPVDLGLGRVLRAGPARPRPRPSRPSSSP